MNYRALFGEDHLKRMADVMLVINDTDCISALTSSKRGAPANHTYKRELLRNLFISKEKLIDMSFWKGKKVYTRYVHNYQIFMIHYLDTIGYSRESANREQLIANLANCERDARQCRNAA